MVISKTVWIILVVSVFVAIFIMIFIGILTILKIIKFKKNTVLKQKKLGNLKKVIDRKNAGELLWDLKEKIINPLEDVQLEFLINTAIRNDYKTFDIINASSNYESVSLIEIIGLKKSNINPDLIIFFINEKTFEQQFNKIYESLKNRQMIAFVNAKKRKKQIKKIIKILKEIQAKYEIMYIGKGIILVTK